ncbi:hypothetical protein [Peribacillus butanolivorans]|uniref:hypothetical protein n=1 Tax=Peribacillus butanolivorans TaxID=421767 RepID=UPI0036D97A50
MDKEFIPIVSAAIVGGATLSVVIINKIVEYFMWKSNLNRKGEEKYLERKIDTLHLTIIDIFELTADTLNLARQTNKGISLEIKKGLESVDNIFRKKIANASPFLDNEIMDNEVGEIYSITSSIRELMLHYNHFEELPEDTNLEEEIRNHIYWLNEALHELKDKLAIIINPLYKPAPKWTNSVLTVSIVFNVLLVIALIISFI